MPSKKTICLAGLMAVMVTIILVQGIYIGLPGLVQYLIKQKLPAFPKGFEPEFTIASVGPTQIRIRDIAIGEGIRADAFDVFYRWQPGRGLDIPDIRISGFALEASLDNRNRTEINGLVLNPSSNQNSDPNLNGQLSAIFQKVTREFPPELARFFPGRIRMDHCRLRMKMPDRTLEFPLHIKAVLSPEEGRLKAYAGVMMAGEALKLTADVDLKGQLEFSLSDVNLSDLNLAQFSPTLKRLPSMRVQGLLGRFDLGTGRGNLDAGLFLGDPADSPLVMDLSLTANLGQALTFELSGKSRKLERFSIDGLSLPVSDRIQSMVLDRPRLFFKLAGNTRQQQAKVVLASDKVSVLSRSGKFSAGQGTLSVKSQGPLLSNPLTAATDLALETETLRIESLNIADNLAENLTVVSGAVAGTATLRASPRVPGHLSDFDLNIQKIGATADTGRVRIGQMVLSGDAHIKESGRILNMEARLARADLRLANRHLSLSQCGWAGQIRLKGGGPVLVDLTPWGKEGSVDLPGEKLTARGLAFKTRLTRPFVRQSGSGQLEIKEIRFQDRIRAGMVADLNQVDTDKLHLKGKLSSEILGNKQLDVTVTTGVDPELWADAHITGRHLKITNDAIKRLDPAMDLPGRIRLDATAEARASFGLGHFESGASLELHDGTVDAPQMNLSVSGITGRLNLRDLVKMESYPGQMVNIQQISLGQFRFEKAALRFRIEDSRTLGIENLRFNWCDGLVSSEAVQIPSEDGQIRLILFCDRLQMDMLLNQMGAFDAQGGGTLTGRIPVTYRNDGFSFENGFLFSTPGRGGRVYVRDLDRFMAGFPKGTPEATYLEMAGEALKDFEYNWATLKMDSQGDTLNVNMELDGKPARILPFEFRKEINAFVRVDADSPGAHFQGIKLDLNLKLPFNQVTKFGKKIRSFMD